MRMRWMLLALASSTLSPGCSLFVTAARNMYYETKLEVQECVEEQAYRHAARTVWEQSCGKYSGSRDFAKGFQAGFVDYLRAGGNGMPPPLPPQHYWGYKYQTPAGHQAIEQWFAGYREGAAVAQSGGWREWVTLPTEAKLPPASPPPLPPPPPLVPVVDGVPGGVAPAPTEEMPTPKTMPPATRKQDNQPPVTSAPAPADVPVQLGPNLAPGLPAVPGLVPLPEASPKAPLQKVSEPLPPVTTLPPVLPTERAALQFAAPPGDDDTPATQPTALLPTSDGPATIRPAEDAFRHRAPSR